MYPTTVYMYFDFDLSDVTPPGIVIVVSPHWTIRLERELARPARGGSGL